MDTGFCILTPGGCLWSSTFGSTSDGAKMRALGHGKPDDFEPRFGAIGYRVVPAVLMMQDDLDFALARKDRVIKALLPLAAEASFCPPGGRLTCLTTESSITCGQCVLRWAEAEADKETP